MNQTTVPDQTQPHGERIDLTRDLDVAFWCRLLDVSHDQLRRAVQRVGPRADAVFRYLNGAES